VQLAQMISRVGQSEMRIGMNTSAFGSVEVRAVVHASDVGLVIGSEKGDLRSLLANDMPAITNTLQQQSLRLNSVNFMQGFAFSNNASGGGDSQQRSFVPQRGFVSSASEAAADDSMEPLPAGEFGSGNSSLSILA
jgi:flagellar hook-length control protein FliK